jgi:hypothetical protein
MWGALNYLSVVWMQLPGRLPTQACGLDDDSHFQDGKQSSLPAYCWWWVACELWAQVSMNQGAVVSCG